MPKLKTFYWRGVDALQRKRQGAIVAKEMLLAQHQLHQQGIYQVKLQRYWRFSNRVKLAEIGEFVNQLSQLLNAHIPIKQSLQILLQSTVNITLYQWISHLLVDIDVGLAFSQSLANHPRYFTFQERQLIQVGEMSGKLPLVLQQIALHKANTLSLQRKVQKILLYPVIILLISLSLTVMLLLFVVPQFAEMYGNSHHLPFLTQLLLNISHCLQAHWIGIVIMSLILFTFGRYLFKYSQLFQYGKEIVMTNLPGIKRIVQLSNLVQFSRGMQLMMQSGVPLNQALDSFLPNMPQWKNIPRETWLQRQIKAMQCLVNQGYPFSECVGNELFSTQLQQMLKVGEKTGQLGKMLQHIAESEQQRLEHQIDLLSQFIEPFMMLMIGALVGVIMVGMYLPIFQMGNMIQ